MGTFTQAAISYHGIPPDVVVRSDVHTGDDGVLYLTVQIPIKDEDMEPIVKRMGQLTEQAQESPAFVPDDDLQLAQWRDDYSALSPQEKGKYKSFQRYKAHRMAEQFEGCAMEWQNTVKHTVDDFGSTEVLLPRRPAVNTRNDVGTCEYVAGPKDPLAEYASTHCAGMEGVGGRKVQHVDVAEEQEAVSELPAAVWVANSDMVQHQMALASEYNEVTAEWLIQVDMLTAEQKEKYCGEQGS